MGCFEDFREGLAKKKPSQWFDLFHRLSLFCLGSTTDEQGGLRIFLVVMVYVWFWYYSIAVHNECDEYVKEQLKKTPDIEQR